MQSVRGSLTRGYLGIASFAVLSLLAGPRTGQASGYYNLGAFWRTQSAGCTSFPASFIQEQDSGDVQGNNVFATLQFTQNAGDTLIAAAYFSTVGQTFAISDTLNSNWQSVLIKSNTHRRAERRQREQ
jgi:hypothetical protein